MKIIDRYIFRKLIPMFFFLLSAVIFLTCLADYLFSYKVSSANLSWRQIFFYYTLCSVFTIKLTLPSIIFLATILVVLRFSNNCELVACLSNGITYKRFLKPFMLFALLLLKILLLCEGWVFPIINDVKYEFEREHFGRQQVKYGFNIHMKLEEDKFLFIKNYNNKQQTGYHVYIDEIKDNKLVSRFFAEKMIYKDNHWTFYNCQKRTYEGREHTLVTEEEKTFDKFNITPDDLIFDKSYHTKLTTEKLNSFAKLPITSAMKIKMLSDYLIKSLKSDEMFPASIALYTQRLLEGEPDQSFYKTLEKIIKEGQKEGSVVAGNARKLSELYWGVVYLYAVKTLYTTDFAMIKSEDLSRILLEDKK